MRTLMIVAVLLAGAAAAPLQAQSQSNTLAPRVDKLEKEMRAVQRKVFPGGSNQFLEPEIGATAQPTTPSGTPASSPVVDLTARVSALEGQLQTLTGQSEQNAFKLRQLDEAFVKFRGDVETRLKALEAGGAPAPTVGTTPTPTPSSTLPMKPTATVTPPAAGKPTTAPPKLTAERQTALEAIGKPDTGDAGEDGYLYGYRLWEAKFFPQAQVQLKATADKYPKHKRWSFAQNLLGRAYLDDGKPALASVAFYDNYQKQPRGERAPDSLYYLGVALTRLKKPADACKVFDEFDEVYGATASTALKAQVVKGRTDAKCK
jgi:TolA-binding protein